MDNQIALDEALAELKKLKETDPEQYAASLKEFNDSLQAYNEKVTALINKLES